VKKHKLYVVREVFVLVGSLEVRPLEGASPQGLGFSNFKRTHEFGNLHGNTRIYKDRRISTSCKVLMGGDLFKNSAY
jgi:hypothetical protein